MWKTPEARSKLAKPKEILKTASSRDEAAAEVDPRRRACRCEMGILEIDFEKAMPNLVKAGSRPPKGSLFKRA
jgi:HSP20 family molecular chaperone IbpA